MHRAKASLVVAVVGVLGAAGAVRGQNAFVNFETPQVNPIVLTPSAHRLLVVNTADARLEVFDATIQPPAWLGSVPVGMDPVSVRARSDSEAWVVNHLSDSISIVDLPTMRVVRTVLTGDEPADVVFAGTPQRAFVSVSQLNQVRVFDLANLAAAPQIVNIQGEDPRAMAVSADGAKVFVAIFESGNPTSIVRRQDVSNPAGPYAGLNPPPNAGNAFVPPITPGLPAPPPVAQIVRRNGAGQWMDDNNRNWSQFVTWNVLDHDVAIIDAATLGVTYADGMVTTAMNLAVRSDGMVTVVGTEARNEVRFESIINGVFLRVRMGSFDPSTPGTTQTVDLNGHLNYLNSNVPQAQRDESVGDPRAIVWNWANGRSYIAGMGSNNVIVTDSTGARVTRIEVGQGPTGLALDGVASRLYVLNRFDGTLSVIDTGSNAETARLSFFDPTPAVVKNGRPFLYDTHSTSGLGHISCASCHVDGRTDHLAWDLGEPSGQMKAFNQTCRGPAAGCEAWHPMKGPMVTQTLQAIVTNEPFHWRGDRENLAAFGPAYTGLQGDDAAPDATQMQQFTDFINTVQFPPNPNRALDNALPTALNVTGGTGNAATGRNIFINQPTLPPPPGGGPGLTCTACHALPDGTDRLIDSPPVLVQQMKDAQLRNMHEKMGWNRASQTGTRGFGFNHDSDFDTVFALLGAGFNFPPGPTGLQQRRDVEAFMMSFSTDTHAAVGQQVTFDGSNNNDANAIARLNTFTGQADIGVVGLIAKGTVGGLARGYVYLGGGTMQSDRAGEVANVATLRTNAASGAEMTFTVVVLGSQGRIGIDRDADGSFDRDEIEACGDPINPAVLAVRRGDANDDGFVDGRDVSAMVAIVLDPGSAGDRPRCGADVNRDGVVDVGDVGPFASCVVGLACP